MAKKPLKSTHIQARLHPEKIREADALAAYHGVKERTNWTDKVIVREALIAMGQMMDSGWQPQEDVTEVKLTASVQTMLRQMSSLVSKLSSLDFSQARHPDGSEVDTETLHRELSEFDKSASDMLGQAIFFDVEDE
jgi:murein L,D-transpeptidase YcbB/YkuD